MDSNSTAEQQQQQQQRHQLQKDMIKEAVAGAVCRCCRSAHTERHLLYVSAATQTLLNMP
jgi:hypothetical protein